MDSSLLDLLKRPLADRVTCRLVQAYLYGLGEELLGHSRVSDFATNISALVECGTDVTAVEEAIKVYLSDLGVRTEWNKASECRGMFYARQISPWIAGGDVLDYGCGNGLVASHVSSNLGCRVVGCDTIPYLALSLPFVVNDAQLPFKDGAFDTVLLVCMLHHTDQPFATLAEARRVARQRLVIKESVWGVGPLRTQQSTALEEMFVAASWEEQHLYTIFVDWFYNRILESDISVPFNFQSREAWCNALLKLGSLVALEDLGIDDKLGALFHVLYVLDL